MCTWSLYLIVYQAVCISFRQLNIGWQPVQIILTKAVKLSAKKMQDSPYFAVVSASQAQQVASRLGKIIVKADAGHSHITVGKDFRSKNQHYNLLDRFF